MNARTQVPPKDEEDGQPQADGQGEGPTLVSMDSAIFHDVNVSLGASLGQVTLSVADLLALKAGAVLKLDLKMNDLIELRLNQSLVARGEIVAVDDNFGVRIVEIAPR